MIADWFKPADPEAAKTAAAGTPASSSGSAEAASDAAARRQQHAQKLRESEPTINRDLSAEELAERRQAEMQRKLAASATGGRGQGPQGVTFDGMFRPLNALLLDQQSGVEFHDGVQLNVQRSMHNAMVASKLTVGSPQAAGWEVSLQSQGFTDVNAVTYSTNGRLGLMHQRMFKSGALGVGQWSVQPTPMGPQGGFYGMLQWPWMRNGATQLSYIKGQQVNLSHAARPIRGTTVGAQLSYDMMQKQTSLTWGAAMQRNNVNWFFQYCPDKGEWKVATSRFDWELDTEMFVQLEMAARKSQGGAEDLMSMITTGIKKPFIGGAVVHATLSGFSRLKAVLELPFGGDREGMNAIALKYCIQYDAIKGAAKHGISLSV